MEYIYFAVSDSHPGMVKIGRTDRPVGERMSELSQDDYGLSDFEGDSVWQAVDVIKVEDNVQAESMLHDHFGSARVENGREIFYSDDVNAMASEGTEIVDGVSIDLFSAGADSSEDLFDGAEIVYEAAMLILSLGGLGIGIAGAALAYDKYKDEKVVKETINTVKLTVDEGKKKWDSSSEARREILDKSAQTTSEILESASEFGDQAKTKWDDSAETRKEIVDKSAQIISKVWQSSSEFRGELQSKGVGVFLKVRNKLRELKWKN